MKRREILKALGIGALSLTGIERLAKAMATPIPESSKPCELTASAVVCVVSASTDDGYSGNLSSCTLDICPVQYVCNGGATNHYCTGYVCTANNTCNVQPPTGDFRCDNYYVGCNGTTAQFQCLGVDPGTNDAQFVCVANFTGCSGGGVFDCDDFKCRSGQYSCGVGHTGCPNPIPPWVICQQPGGYHS